MKNLNTDLSKEIKLWKKSGSRDQGPVNWTSTQSNWIEGFPKHSSFLKSLPSDIDRNIVRDICSSTAASVLEKFLVTMVWGYSDRGYGAYRVSKMLAQENSKEILSEVLSLSNRSKPIEAYEFLKTNRVHNLGPSYGTKFITFNTPRQTSAPILDSLILLWLKEFASGEFEGVNLNTMSWNVKTYSAYCQWIAIHAERDACFPDEVELVLFRMAEEKFAKASGWAGK
jgi:hypothetical protein